MLKTTAVLILTAAAATAQAPTAAITRYCVTCHNAKLKTAGLVLDPAELTHVSSNAETWEKVIRKLRTNSMPPAGAPRPDQATYDSAATYLETELDKAAAAKPNPGKLPLLHRLSRTEYANAVRDMLAISALPKEIDYTLLLPPDNSGSGFDNLADLLFVSPTSMDRYLNAAEKISRLAVGDPTAPVMVNTYRLPVEGPQGARLDDLSFGTRGGVAIKNDFPADGEYVVKFEVVGTSREPHQLEVTVDGERMKIASVTANPRGGGPAARTGDPVPDRPSEFRIPVKAGPRLIGVTFVQRTEAREEGTLRLRKRARGVEPALATVIISGPYNAKTPGDTPSRHKIFVCKPASGAELPCAKQILSNLARAAYRRPVTDADLADLMPFFNSGSKDGGFERGIQMALERLLVSPQFLFRAEHDPVGIARISDLELASRLSFFLWSSIPDDELLKAKLSDPAVLEKQVHRMLADPRSESMVTNFAAQWLYLRDIEAKDPDEILFPDFDETLRAAMHRETELFLDSILRENRSVLDLLTANYTFVNERLAKHYGIPNISGSYFRRVTFPEGSVRGGLLGQGSVLTLTSYATRTSPVLRGKWVLENLLSSPPPPPPPNIPALKTEAAEPGKVLSMREAMTRHRAEPSCASCHARMDPIGFAMENFDAIGQWRDKDGGQKIDTSGVLPDGSKFDGLAGLKKALLKHPDQFVGSVTEKLLMYAVGRNPQYFDAPAVRKIVRESAAGNYTFESLIMGVVKSAPFQMREAAVEARRQP